MIKWCYNPAFLFKVRLTNNLFNDSLNKAIAAQKVVTFLKYEGISREIVTRAIERAHHEYEIALLNSQGPIDVNRLHSSLNQDEIQSEVLSEIKHICDGCKKKLIEQYKKIF